MARLHKLLHRAYRSPLLRKSASTSAVRVAGLLINFAFVAMMGRYYGAETVGRYSIAYILLMIGASVAVQGLSVALTRFVGSDVVDGSPQKAVGRLRYSVRRVASIGLVLSFGLLVAAVPMAEFLFNDAGIAFFLIVMGTALAPYALVQILSGYSLGKDKPALSMAFSFVAVPGLACVLLFTAAEFGADARAVPVSYTVAAFVVTVIAVPTLSRGPRELLGAGERESMLQVAAPLLWANIAGMLLGWADTLMLGAIGTSEQAGLYAAAFRIALFASLARQIAIKAVSGTLVRSIAEQDRRAQQRILSFASHLGFFAALPFIVLGLLFPEALLGLFGSDFPRASTALQILLTAELIALSFGAAAIPMQMGGLERAYSRSVWVALAANVALNAILIPTYGFIGAAWATAITLIGQRGANGLVLWHQRRLVSFVGFSWLALRTQSPAK